MKNKKLLYVLIPGVLLVWGIIIYKIAGTTSVDNSIGVHNNQFIPGSVTEILNDTFSINPNYRDAKVPTHLEVPEVEVIFVENYDPYGVFGGKVVGEPPITAAVATIANAIFNATGKRFKVLPITPDKIVQAVQV